MEKSQFAHSETQIIEEAKQLRNKLMEVKKRKESQINQAIRADLTEIYTQKFE